MSAPVRFRRHAVTIAMAALAVLLALYLYVVDRGRVTTSEAEARKRNLFKAYRRGEISELVVQQGTETIRIVKRSDDAGGDMYYLEDGEVADTGAVDKLLSALEFATPERRVEEALDRHAIGLDAPRIRLTISMGSITYRLAVGGPAPSPPGAAYAELQGEGPSVVGKELVAELGRPRDAYRGRTLVPYLSTTLAEFSLDGGGPTRRFVHGAWGGWGIEYQGRIVRVDRDVFDKLLTSFADMRAEAFPEQAEAERALAEAAAKIRLTMIPEGTSLPRGFIEAGGDCPGKVDDVIVARREPAPKKAGCVVRGVMDALSMAAERFVDRQVFSLRADEMEQVALEAGGQKLELVRLGVGWHMRAPSDGEVDADVGQGFARTLQDLSAEEVVALARPEDFGFSAAPRGRATLTKVGAGDGPLASETVELGAETSDGFAYARRLVDGAVLKLTRDVARALVPSGFALRSRKVIDEAPARIRQLSIESAAVHQVLRRSSSGEWSLDEPKSLAVDPRLADDLAEALAHMRADRWVADEDDGSFGFAHPPASYQLDLEGRVIRVETGRATSGGVFARRADQPGIFVLPQALQRLFETWAVDRSYFMVEAASVRQIRLEKGGERRVLEPAGVHAEPFEVARAALAEARTEGMVHLGSARKEEGFDKPLLALSVMRAAPAKAIEIVIGRGDVWRDTNVFYVRRRDIDATFAMAKSKLRPLLELR